MKAKALIAISILIHFGSELNAIDLNTKKTMILYIYGSGSSERETARKTVIDSFSHRVTFVDQVSIDSYCKRNKIAPNDLKSTEVLKNVAKTIYLNGNMCDYAIIMELTIAGSEPQTWINNKPVGYTGHVGGKASIFDIKQDKVYYRDIYANQDNTLGGLKAFVGIKSGLLSKEDALNGAFEKAAEELYHNFIKIFPLKGRLVYQNGELGIINLGKINGIKEGTSFNISYNDIKLGELTVTKCSGWTSEAKVSIGNKYSNLILNIAEETFSNDVPVLRDIPLAKGNFQLKSSRTFNLVGYSHLKTKSYNDTTFYINGPEIGSINNSTFVTKSYGALDTYITDFVAGSGSILIFASGSRFYFYDLYLKSIEKDIKCETAAFCLDFSISKNCIFSGHDGGIMYLTNLENFSQSKIFSSKEEPITAIKCGEKYNAVFAGTGSGCLIVLDCSAGFKPTILKTRAGPISCLYIDSIKNLLFVGYETGIIKAFDIASLKLKTEINVHVGGITKIINSPDERYILSAGKDTRITIFDRNTLQEVSSFNASNDILDIVFGSQDANLLSVCSNGRLEEYNLEDIPIIEQQRELPATLIAEGSFSDVSSLFPNNTLDAAEDALLLVELKNEGPGTAYDTFLNIENSNAYVTMPNNLTIGSLAPNGDRVLEIPIKSNLSLQDGQLEILLNIKEKRGYDARPFKIIIITRHLDHPALTVSSYKINDGQSGQANGDGDGIPENGEKIELIAYVKNTGVGTALGSKMQLSNQPAEIVPDVTSYDLGDVLPNETKTALFVLSIPRDYSASHFNFNLKAFDSINATEFNQAYTQNISQRTPALTFNYTIVDSRGVELTEISNGESFIVKASIGNNGSIDAQNVQMLLSAADQSIYIPENSNSIASVPAGNLGIPVLFNISLARSFQQNQAILLLKISQKEFAGLTPTINIPVAAKRPQLKEELIVNTSDGDQDIELGENVELLFLVENDGDLSAEDVKTNLELNYSGIDFREKNEKYIGAIPSGETRQIKYNFYVKNSAKPGELPIMVSISQADGFPTGTKTVTRQINSIGTPIYKVQGEENIPRPGFILSSIEKQPPRITIISPPGNKVYKNPSTFTIIITDDKPVRNFEPEIQLNQKLVSKEDLLRGIAVKDRQDVVGNNNDVTLHRSLFLNEGENIISATLYDADNERGFAEVKVTYLKERVDIYAIVVGISSYQNTDLNLKSADRDAQAFADFLTSPAGGSVPKQNVKLMMNQSASLREVKSALNTTLSTAYDEDLVILYFACHGIPENEQLYLVMHDSDPTDLFSTALPQSDLERLLSKRVKSNKVIMFADACHSGNLGLPQVRSSRSNRTNELLRGIAGSSNGLAILAAADGNEFSLEDVKWGGGHGVFTYYLLEGLKGNADENGDGLVRSEELFSYVRREVPRATEGKQHPQVIDRGYDRELPLGIAK